MTSTPATVGRPTKLTAQTARTILDVVAAGGTRSSAAKAAGVHRDTIQEWLRRGEQDTADTTTPPDSSLHTAAQLRGIARDAGITGLSRMNKGELAAAIAAQPSQYSYFTDNIKKAEAATEVEWLTNIARIGQGEHLETVTTEELDDTGVVTKRTTRVTTTHKPAWQAFAWLLERRHPADWCRRTQLVLPDHEQNAEVDPLVGVHDELRLARLARQKQLDQEK